MNIIDALVDVHLFRPLFRDLSTWRAWFIVLKAIFALEMTQSERDIFVGLTHRNTPPTSPVEEAWLVCGRRGGKSFIVALIAVFLACFRDYRPCLGPGERGVLMIIATDRKQARVIMRYVTALLQHVPMLATMVDRQDTESIDLDNCVSIEITTASYRTIRGYTVVAALCDEIAFWRSEDSANPAEEILAALRPAMSTIPGSLLLGLSSPYKRTGPLYENYRRHYGKESPVLVVQADTRTMNPSVPQSVIDRAFEVDPVSAAAEWLAEFRSDVATFLDADWIDRAISDPGRTERPPLPGVHYYGFVDPSGGGRDAFTLAIAHQERDGTIVLDVCRGRRPPFDPSSVVSEYTALLGEYRCFSATGDRYAGQWVTEAFRAHGLTYKPSQQTKSELYLEVEPLFARKVVQLLDCRPLLNELQQLERRARSGGKDSVDHPPHGRDDFANAACGALVLAAQRQRHTAGYQQLSGY